MKNELLILVGCYLCFISCTEAQLPHENPKDETASGLKRIENWLDSTDIYFPVDSLNSYTQLSLTFIKEEFTRIGIKYCDSTNSWAKTPLSNIITYGGREKDSFRFYYNMGNDPRSSLITSYISSRGFVYGSDLLHQLYSMLNFESNEKYKQVVTISPPVMGKSEFETDLFWSDSGLVARSDYLKEAILIPKTQNNKFVSNSVRDCISVPDRLLKLTYSQYEEIASEFLSDYYKRKFAGAAALTFKAPPTVSVKKIKGFITSKDGFWEEDQIRIDNIQQCEGKKLLVQCTIDGFYIKVKSDDYEPAAFEKPYILQRDYPDEINASGLRLINDFREYLKNK